MAYFFVAFFLQNFCFFFIFFFCERSFTPNSEFPILNGVILIKMGQNRSGRGG